jgi:hypothetical protein
MDRCTFDDTAGDKRHELRPGSRDSLFSAENHTEYGLTCH